jgi:multiple sugar transport system ATP-binding protein
MVYVTHDQTEALTLGDRIAVMRTGLLQQVGSPQELYERPRNLFVAGFIGSPSMNFMPARVDQNTMRTPLGDILLTDRLLGGLERAKAPRDLIVGIRPESFEDAALVPADDRPDGITFRATIDVLESVGSDVFVYFTRELEQGVDAEELRELARDSGRAEAGTSGDTVVARIDTATRIRENDNAELWVDTRALHVFDPATGLNIALDSQGGAA